MYGLPELLIVLVVVFAVFIVGRELNLWYFKINEHIALQREIRDQLKQLVFLSGGRPPLPDMSRWSEKDRIAFMNSSTYAQYAPSPGQQDKAQPPKWS